ncbi:MAG: DNA polymerase III subunit alpha, partial [Thermodesulfovibrionales bacterium]
MHQHSDYIPLHLHTEYSLLDGSIKIDELIELASHYRMPALAITDHGNLFGAIEFYKKASKAGIKPIIGCEVYVSPGSRFDKKTSESPFHLILLARDNEGYSNLSTLITKAYTEGFYYKPRIDKELLERYSKGLIGLSSCLKGEIPHYLGKEMTDEARKAAIKYMEIFGKENFYIELQDNGLQEQIKINRKLIELARELELPMVATNDCHYLKPEDARAHDVLVCIQTGKTVNDPNRMRFGSQQFYFKSPEEMKKAFDDIPSAIKATWDIAERCNVRFDLNAQLLPSFNVDKGISPELYLKELATSGLKNRFGNPPEIYSDRLSMELDVINRMKYAPYFLIVWDFIRFARERGIPVGPGRGSAAGSLVAYCLGITEIDPIKYNLLFERFLNPERISMPDIDVDFCTDRRPEVIAYVAEKYGHDRVSQIITFGTMAAKGAIRDVGRALAMPYAEVDKIAKLIPEGPNIPIDEALKIEPQLKELYDTNPKIKDLLDIAKRLEGLCRHASTHAAGVVVSPKPLTDLVPLYKNPTDNTITTQFDMTSIESLGLLKFDFLGLKTLTIIEKTLRHIRASKGIDLSLKDLPLEDELTYKLLCSGQTTGIFQLESSGMRDLLVKMQPDCFEDLIALVALYRPGPLGSGMVDDFIKRKKGLVPVKYEIPQLKEILSETYGVILYQEQVMRIANKLANFTMGQADILRKAMGKKKPEEMEKQKEAFIKGAIANGIPGKKATRLFDLMAFFAEYGFNKSHSAAYAYLAYQTAYLKAHYPVEFMAANLSADMDKTDKIIKAISECRKMSITILPPDINESEREFKVIGNAIRFGLEAVKGVGSSAIESILEIREKDGPFKSFEDFLQRIESKRVNKKVIEGLIKAGAFDSTGIGRKEALSILERPRNNMPVYNLFDDKPSIAQQALHENTSESISWTERSDILRFEKESLGFYITDHPLSSYREHLRMMNYRRISELEDLADREEVLTAAVISNIKKIRTKDKGEIMAYVTVEDEEGNAEVLVFPDLYKELGSIIQKDSIISIKGSIDKTEKGIKIISREIQPLDTVIKDYKNSSLNQLEVSLKLDTSSRDRLILLRDTITEYPGSLP